MTPLNSAADQGNDRCVELLLADPRVDVCRACTRGQTPLVSACAQLMVRPSHLFLLIHLNWFIAPSLLHGQSCIHVFLLIHLNWFIGRL